MMIKSLVAYYLAMLLAGVTPQCPSASQLDSFLPAAAYEAALPGLFVTNTDPANPNVCGVGAGTELCCDKTKIAQAADKLASQKKAAFKAFFEKIGIFASQAYIYDGILNTTIRDIPKKNDSVLNASIGDFNVTNTKLVDNLRKVLSSASFNIRLKLAKMALPSCMDAHSEFYARAACYICTKNNYKANSTSPGTYYLNNSYYGSLAITPDSAKARFKKCVPVWRFTFNVVSVMSIVIAAKKVKNDNIKLPVENIRKYIPGGNISNYFANSETLVSDRMYSCDLDECSPSNAVGFYGNVFQVSTLNPFFNGAPEYIQKDDSGYSSNITSLTTDVSKKTIGFITQSPDPLDLFNLYTNVDFTVYWPMNGITMTTKITNAEVEEWTKDVVLVGHPMFTDKIFSGAKIFTLFNSLILGMAVTLACD